MGIQTMTIVISSEMATTLMVIAAVFCLLQGVNVVLDVLYLRNRKKLAASLARIGTSRAEERAEHIFPERRR